jgi:hypothetical protein
MKKYFKNKNIVIIIITLTLTNIVFWSCEDTDYTILPDPIQQLSAESVSATEGLVGSEITITGSNFSVVPSNNKVLFNDVSSIVKSVTETELVVEIPNAVPSGKTSAVVSLSVSHGQYSVDLGDFTVVKPIVDLVIPLTDDNDDVEEVAVDFGDPVGTMKLDSSDLELGEKSSGEGLMNIGLRYNNISIPKGVIINKAFIQFNTDNTGSNPVELTIYGENSGNAQSYSVSLGDLSSRPLTSANEIWSVPEWVNIGDRGNAQKTINIASIIQEIVNRSDWEPGNSINIIMKHSGVSLNATSSSGGREAENYSPSAPEHGAELTIQYQ